MADETKTFTITAPAPIMRRLEGFLALMHFNAGHSAMFGMCFDGDGNERLQVAEGLDSALRRPAQACGGFAGGLEIATGSAKVPYYVKQRQRHDGTSVPIGWNGKRLWNCEACGDGVVRYEGTTPVRCDVCGGTGFLTAPPAQAAKRG